MNKQKLREGKKELDMEELLIPLYAAIMSWYEPIDDRKFKDDLKKAYKNGDKKKMRNLIYSIGSRMSLEWGIEVFEKLGMTEEVKRLKEEVKRLKANL